MTRTLTTAVLAAVLLTNNLMAQDVRPHSLEADPIASATERIMNRFFPAREQARTVDELQVEDESEPLPWWGVPMLDVPSFYGATRSMPSRLAQSGSWLSTARSMSAMSRLQPPRENAPAAFSSAVANGNYAIEAVVPTERGFEKVRLNGSRLEIERQFDALPVEIRDSIGPNLGL